MEEVVVRKVIVTEKDGTITEISSKDQEFLLLVIEPEGENNRISFWYNLDGINKLEVLRIWTEHILRAAKEARLTFEEKGTLYYIILETLRDCAERTFLTGGKELVNALAKVAMTNVGGNGVSEGEAEVGEEGDDGGTSTPLQ